MRKFFFEICSCKMKISFLKVSKESCTSVKGLFAGINLHSSSKLLTRVSSKLCKLGISGREDREFRESWLLSESNSSLSFKTYKWE